MAVDDWDPRDIRASCPSCGSEEVIVEVVDGYFFVVLCKKCGYKVNSV